MLLYQAKNGDHLVLSTWKKPKYIGVGMVNSLQSDKEGVHLILNIKQKTLHRNASYDGGPFVIASLGIKLFFRTFSCDKLPVTYNMLLELDLLVI